MGAKVTAGAMPVPARDTDCGLPTASSVMFTAAARAPGPAGVKLTLIVQLAPGATEPAPVGQVLPAAKAKSAACAPVMVMLVRLSGAASLLVSVTFCPALVVPTRCRSEEHTAELQSRPHLVCRLLLEKKYGLPGASFTIFIFFF